MNRVHADQTVLDNAVWHAIDGPCAALADRLGSAGRFHREVAPFAAMDGDAWDDLEHLVGAGKVAILFGPHPDAPSAWDVQVTLPCYQMVADNVTEHGTEDGLVELTTADVPEMLDLVAATQPGPFGPRTIEFGRYLGYREGGRLVAMTGERLRCRGYTEVSAVCVADDYRGKGLGRRLVLAVVDQIRARGDEAFLHVETRNTPAYELYLALGFTVRMETDATIFRHKGD